MNHLPHRRSITTTIGLALLSGMTALAIAAPGDAAAMTTGSGKVASETRAHSDFEAISMAGSFKLEVRQGTKESVTVSGDDNLLPLVETSVESTASGRTLVIRNKRGESYRTRSELKVSVEVVKLTALSSAGSGNLHVEGLKTPLLKLTVAGASDAMLRALDTDALTISIAGSGDVKASGNARKLRLSIAGSGDAALGDLVSDEVSVSVAGSGDALVVANKSLTATVAGSGDIRYRGTASELKTTVMGSGSVRKQ